MKRLAFVASIVALAACGGGGETPAADTAAPAVAPAAAPVDSASPAMMDSGMKHDTMMKK